ncbi:MAG: signal recognition particle-docking protein FtsY [Thermofilaceae archaeon]|nr:signal recognition particle-docking protein FtsY [Thermofilaceae archaeon]MCX8180215.1 signal recognition particle-docking protein FtsY [Thermofilaceae archaeon]MDW8003605.1 signal recognition particle-docking protein FtsY [Thermofilaceae archaeon]
MLEGLRAAVRQITSLLTTSKLSEEDLEEIEQYVVYKLLECDVALEAAEAVAKNVGLLASSLKVSPFGSRDKLAEELMRQAMIKIFERAAWFDFEETVLSLKKVEPVRVLFVGPNGHGKTTTLAKVGYRLRKRGLSVVFAAADTWRAGAIEQLKIHAETVGAEVIGHGYRADPAAVAYDAVSYARKQGRNVVLIDTAGRLQTDVNLMEEIAKISRVVKPHFKIFVGDALTGNDALDQALSFHRYVGIDGGILTKVDADAKGGAALSFVYATSKPILYIGTGQGYEDLKSFSVEWFLERVLGQ